MRYREFSEARKNPEQNPKTSINDVVLNKLQSVIDDRVANTPNAFASFTDVDKLGVNPRSKYDTPLGIYSYPINYVVTKVGISHAMSKLPFAGSAPYVNIFSASPSSNIIDVSGLTEFEAKQYYDKLGAIVANKGFNDNTILGLIRLASKDSKFPESIGGVFWYVTMKVAELLSRGTRSTNWRDRKSPVVWNKLFRSMGIDGAVDSQGLGIIHEAEPVQAVFFSTSAITSVERHYNKYSPSSKEQAALIGSKLKTAKTPEEVFNLLKTDIGFNKIDHIKNPKTREYILTKYPNAINYVKNPTPRELFVSFKSLIKQDPANLIFFSTDESELPVYYELIKAGEDVVIPHVLNKYHSLPKNLEMLLIGKNPKYVLDMSNPSKFAVQQSLDQWNTADGAIPPGLQALAKKMGVVSDKLPQETPPQETPTTSLLDLLKASWNNNANSDT